MNASFRVDGHHEVEIRGDGSLSSADNKLQSFSGGKIGIQVHETPLPRDPSDPAERRTVTMFYVTPSQARAIASVLLSAATEAKAAP